MKLPIPRGKKAILVLGLPLGLALAGGIAYMALAGSGESSGPPPVPDPERGQHGVMLALEERVVNLQAGGPYRYAKVGVTVEIRPETADFYALAGELRAEAEKEAIAAHGSAVPLLLDAIGTVVSAADSKTLVTPDGRMALKEQLLHAIGEVLGEEEVLDIYFTDLVMQ